MSVFAILALGSAILMTHAGLILDLPHPYTLIQFSYRLETYVLLALCAAMLAALVLIKSWPARWRMWSCTTVVVILASAIGAVQQVDNYPRRPDRLGLVHPDRYFVFDAAHQPPFSGGLGDYNDASTPLVEPAGPPVGLVFPTDLGTEKTTLFTPVATGTLVHTDISGAPYMVRVRGARIVGHDSAGHMVLDVGVPTNGKHEITLERSQTLPVAGGRLITRISVTALIVMLVAYLARKSWLARVRRRRV